MSKKPNRDIPGNSMASAQAVAQYWYDVGNDVGSLDKYVQVPGHDAPELYELKIKCDVSDSQGVLIMAKGLAEDGYVVGFHRGETIVEALQGMSRRLRNGTLKWKVDQYASNK